MKITNQYKNTKIEKAVEDDVSLILGNNLGDFLYLAGTKGSRYQGFYHMDSSSYEKRPNVYKVIDEISITGRGEINELKNSFFKVERKSADGITEDFFIPDGHDALCLKLSKLAELTVDLDIRTPYDSRQMGRFYEVELLSDALVVKFTKRRDASEDSLGDKKEFSLYLAVKTDKDAFKPLGEFFSKYYPRDHERNSWPWDRYVYRAFKMNCKKAVFAAGKTKKDALGEAENVYKNYDKLYKKTRDEHSELAVPDISDAEIKMAHLSAQNSLRTLLVKGKQVGAYAGIPWFFQYWHRDEALSLIQLYKLDKKAAEAVINSQLDAIIAGKSFPKQRFPESAQELQSADAVGILARSCQAIFRQHRVSKAMRQEVVKRFEKIVPMLAKERTTGNLAMNYACETWMDSLERAGARIEVQAGRLALYKFLFSETGNTQYKLLLEDMERETVKQFVKEDGSVWDAPDDAASRPNVFLAYYLYPELMLKERWERCFDKLLPELYLDWGGIASISQSDGNFHPHDSGENSVSYHNGDSWYFINNLTAWVLYDLNASKYSEYINEIMDASTREILYMGAIGHHSEISSADVQEAGGCLAQLWSAAMYLEFFDRAMGE